MKWKPTLFKSVQTANKLYYAKPEYKETYQLSLFCNSH